jgi:copper transport protein
LPRVADLWQEDYGRVLVVKLGLVCVALSWGAFHHFVARPALEGRGGEGVLGRLSHSLVGESAVGMAVLLAAAVLVDSKPPPQPQPSRPSPASAPAGPREPEFTSGDRPFASLAPPPPDDAREPRAEGA